MINYTADQIQEIFLTKYLNVQQIKDILKSYELENGKKAKEELVQKIEIALLKVLREGRLL